jgi:hypothetical protein
MLQVRTGFQNLQATRQALANIADHKEKRPAELLQQGV